MYVATESDVARAAKELLRRRRIRRSADGFFGFVQEMWSEIEPETELKIGWAMEAIAEHLQATAEGQITRLMINVPPGMSKSMLTSVFFPAWVWTRSPSKRFLGTAHKENLAIRDNRKCRSLIQSARYQSAWGNKFQITSDQNQKSKFENNRYGFREAMAFTSLTGSRGDFVLLDDPLSVDDAKSETIRQNVAETFTTALPSRINDPEKSVIILIMQRLHEEDPSGIILAEDYGYEKLILPMEFEPDRKCYTSIGFEDPRTEEGELLFPERFPRSVVERDKKIMMSLGGSYAVAGQFQQSPAPKEGGLFKREWFNRVVDAVPAGTRWVRGWDLAGSVEKDSAKTAGVKLGVTPIGEFIVGDCVAEKLTWGGVKQLIQATAIVDGRACRGSLPQDPGQAGKAQVIDLIKMLAGYPYRFSPESGNKETRAEPFAAQCEVGNVMLLRGPWIKDYVEELCLFPVGKYADRVDATSRAFMELLNQPALGLAGVQG